ncbi:DUF2953 domain-containing protein [Tepidibacillus fermentans]|uniref:DUF2953 family protein n=1 Tax=Tepidibacillus fermentans TaxID=1281767 RepID=A0A4R3KJY7_9BACI|nr:DUF2953 domain-containing protein [Tepidibacillus fermentans]TCS84095.1 DUF2953 family protein [Tepidibacillus fermentans]
MDGLLWLIFILFLIVFLTLISEIKIQVRIKKEDKDDRIEMDGWLFRFIHIKKIVSLVVLESLNEGVKYKSRSNLINQQEKKDRITKKKIKKWSWDYTKLLVRIDDFYGVFKDFLKKVHIDQLKWETKIGLDEAVATGIFAGLIWSIKGNLIGFLSKYIILDDKPNLNVHPVFNNILFHTFLETTIRFRVGSIVSLGIKIIFRFVKKWFKNRKHLITLSKST